jgi:hypothetical protein
VFVCYTRADAATLSAASAQPLFMDLKIVAVVPPEISVDLKEATEGVQVFEVRTVPSFSARPLTVKSDDEG